MPHLLARDAGGTVLAEKRWPAGAAPSFDTALDALLAFGDAHLGHDGLAAVGHRVVHGGTGHIALDLITRRCWWRWRLAGSAAYAGQSCSDACGWRSPSRATAGRLLRHGVSSHVAAGSQTVRPAACGVGRGRAPLRLSRPLRVHCRLLDATASRLDARSLHRRASRLRSRAFVAAAPVSQKRPNLNAKSLPKVRPVTVSLDRELLLPCNVSILGQLEAVFELIRSDVSYHVFLHMVRLTEPQYRMVAACGCFPGQRRRAASSSSSFPLMADRAGPHKIVASSL